MSALFEHHPHPHIKHRQLTPPPKVADGHIGVNGQIATFITNSVGNMWFFYALGLIMFAWMAFLGARVFNDPYPFALMLLVIGGIFQALAMVAIMVGQQVLGAASDKRAIQTYQDAEAILHECLQLQEHLQAQDHALLAALQQLEQVTGRKVDMAALEHEVTAERTAADAGAGGTAAAPGPAPA